MIKSSITKNICLGIGDWNLFRFGYWCLILGIYMIPLTRRFLIQIARNSYHRIKLLAQVRPPPKAVRTIKSLF